MYIVPKHMDPAYSTPAGRPEPPTPVFAARALPAKPGDYLVWNQCIMRWAARRASSPSIRARAWHSSFSAATFNPS